MPSGTPGLRALTGGLLIVMTATLPYWKSVASSLRFGHVDELLADVLPVEHPDEGRRGVLDPDNDGFAVLELAGSEPFGHLLETLPVARRVVENQEPLDLGPFLDELPQEAGAQLRLVQVVL